ncbi:MAG: hypothetical protein V3T53_08225 [Phycisphaerales bacterium]
MPISEIVKKHRFVVLGGVFVAVLSLAVPRLVFSTRPPPGGGLPVNTTLNDFFMPGTQPDPEGMELLPIVESANCVLCHAGFDEVDPPLNLEGEPFRNWVGSMMAQASRDPIFYAALTVANQDSEFGGDLCLRCHASAAWLGGRSVPTDGSAFDQLVDFEGVTCHFCHRLVNPQFVRGESPKEDIAILEALEMQGLLPAQPGTARYVVDPDDVRRGPFDPDQLPYNPHPPIFGIDIPPIILSPFHTKSDLCATCHDVSNPIFTRAKDGSYVPNMLDAPHPTMDKFDMFPIERTYSEWQQSQFADGGVVIPDGRFGGNLPDDTPLESCQDCHMPDQQSHGCRVPGFNEYDNMPQHAFNGGNTWVLRAVRDLYPDFETGLTDEIVDAALTRVADMLHGASDLELTVQDDVLNVRVINFAGHKLPTGYAEGRRIWVNVKFFDEAEQLIQEHGAYDFDTAILNTGDTKVYEAQLGLDETMAALTGLPAGVSHHFVLNNTFLFDNRIPPIGFTNAAFELVQAKPVGYTYDDGQYWDDTQFAIPKAAVQAVVTLYYQTTSKEYIEFLLNENTTDDRGQIAFDQWVLHGKSAPAEMDMGVIDLAPSIPGDLNGDGTVGAADLLILLANWGPCGDCDDCIADIDGDCTVGASDLLILLVNWG